MTTTPGAITDKDGRTETEGEPLTALFNFASKMLVYNLEVAALMGEGTENDGKSLPGGVQSRTGIAEMKLAQKGEKKRQNEFFDRFIQILVQEAIVERVTSKVVAFVETYSDGV